MCFKKAHKVLMEKLFCQVVATLLWEVRGKDAKEVRSKIREEVGHKIIHLNIFNTNFDSINACPATR